MSDRAQALTFEAILAAVVIIGAVVFALQVAAVTPNSPSTAAEFEENQHRALAEGALDAAVANETLVPTLLYWNSSTDGFHGTEDGYYVSRPPPTEFGDVLHRTFGDLGIKYNVDVYYVTNENEVDRQRLVSHGTPTDHAVRATTTVTLFGDEPLIDATESATNVTIEDTETFYAPEIEDSASYNVLRVEVVVWRT